jgi:hypothetical protein
MADNFAMGNALMAFGQTAGNAVNNYFNEQIGAAQKAQESTLKQMQFKAEQDDKQQTRTETNRHNLADEGNTAAKAAQEAKYQSGLLENDTNKTKQQGEYQNQEIAVRKGELGNQEANTASEISHRTAEEKEADARIAQEGGKGSAAALTAGEKLQSDQLKELQGQLKKINPTGASITTDDQKKQEADIQKQITAKQAELAHSRAELTKAGKLSAPLDANDQGEAGTSPDFSAGIAPKAPPQKGPTPAGQATQTKPAGTGGQPLQPGAKTATNPSTGEKVQFVNGAWIPVNG